MGHYSVAVIQRNEENDDDIMLRMLGLMPEHIDYYNDSMYAKIRYAEPGIDERVIAVPSGEFVADRFGTDEEYDKLELYAVLDQYDCFVTDEPECREIIENRDRSKWLYVFECHI